MLGQIDVMSFDSRSVDTRSIWKYVDWY